MIPRILHILRRLSVIERIALVMVLGLPFLVGVALALALFAELRVIVGEIALGYYLATLIVAALAIFTRLRRWNRFQREQESLREATLIGAPLNELPESWLDLAAGELDRARVVRASAALPAMSIFAFGARSRSHWIREVYAYSATRGRLGFADLTAAVRAGAVDPEVARLSIGRADPALLLALARLLMSQATSRDELEVAYDYLAHLGTLAPDIKLATPNQVMLAERLILAGRIDLARPIVARWASDGLVESMLAADVLNPAHGADDRELWLATFNAVHHLYGLEQVRLLDDGPTPYDRLTATAVGGIEGGPLVSIVMSAFRPGEALFTALRSVVQQTWQNWELLVLDDGSGAEFDSVFARAAELDPRVRIVRSPENLGTYARRNEGILAARGEFVTMHDSDDWAHPRRIEIQVRHLLAHPETPANTSASLRLSEDLMFVQPRGTKLRLTETSLLFRRDAVTSRVGFYDSLRKAADSEFRLRIEAAFGVAVPLLHDAGPLSLVRYSRDSLSGTELGDGWMHPARLAYRSAYLAWHRRVAAGTSDPFVPYPLRTRHLPVHPHLLGRSGEATETDVLLVLDGRPGADPEGVLDRVVEEVDAVLEAGRSIALLPVDALHADRSIGELHEALQERVNSGAVRQATVHDDLRARLVVVRNASVLQGADPGAATMNADRVVIVEDRGSRRDRFGENFTWIDVDRVATAWFGRQPERIRVTSGVSLVSLLGGTAGDDPSRAPDVEELRSPGEGPSEVGTLLEPSVEAATLSELLTELGDDPVIAVAGAADLVANVAATADRERPQPALRVVNGNAWLEPSAEGQVSLAIVGVDEGVDVAASVFERIRPALAPDALIMLDGRSGSGLDVLRAWFGQDENGELEAMRTAGGVTVLRFRPGR